MLSCLKSIFAGDSRFTQYAHFTQYEKEIRGETKEESKAKGKAR